MKDKTQKNVFTIIVISILFIAIFLTMSYYSSNKKIVISQSKGSTDISEYVEDGSTNETNQQDNNQTTESVPSFNNGFKCISYAFDVLEKSPGIKYTSYVTGITDILGIGSATQYVKEVSTLSGNHFLKETWATCTVSLGQNYYRCFYSEDNLQNVLYKKTSSYGADGIPNWGNTIINVNTNKEEILQKYDLIAFTTFSFVPTKQNSTLIKFDRINDKKYYVISFSYNPSSVSAEYIQNILQEGGLSSVNISSINVTYYVEKDTMYIRKCEINQVYSLSKMGFSLNVNMYQEMFINSIGKAIIPQKPEYI